MDYLESMRMFATVAQAGSFAEAARKLRLSPSVVTRSIAQLEDHLGLVVLNRTTRSVRVTERGRIYLERCKQILDDVEGAERLARGQDAELRGELTVAAPVMFGRLHVLPIVGAMLSTHRGLAIRLLLSDRNAHLVDDGVDVAVRVGELADSTAIAVKLATVHRVLVASSAYITARGAPAKPSDLAAYDVIAFEGLERTDEWRFRDDRSVRVNPRLTVDSADAAIAAAEAGLGITRVMSYQVQASVRAGRLVELLPAYATQELPVNALYASRRAGANGVAAFVATARQHFRDHPLEGGLTAHPSRKRGSKTRRST
jgi:DNA-binding transcriptional LysR family regulator